MKAVRRFMLRHRINWKHALLLFIICGLCLVVFNNPGSSHSGLKRAASVNDNSDVLHFRQQRYEKAQSRSHLSHPGENGAAVVLGKDDQKLADDLFDKEAFNIIASDKVALDRSIPDVRLTEYVRSQ